MSPGANRARRWSCSVKGRRDRSFKARAQLKTDVTGGFSTKQKVKKTAEYRAVIAGTSACAAAESTATKVKAKKRKKRRA